MSSMVSSATSAFLSSNPISHALIQSSYPQYLAISKQTHSAFLSRPKLYHHHRRHSTLFVYQHNSTIQASDATPQVSEATFESEVLNSTLPVLVDFWAPWCGPCRMVAPVVEEVADEYQGRLKVVKLNTDENPAVASEYGIRSIPTLILFKDGKKADTIIGAIPKSTLISTIDKHI